MAKVNILETLIINITFSGFDAGRPFTLPGIHGHRLAEHGFMGLCLNPRPKDITRGFVFGSESKSCDILLANNKDTGISGNHFSVQIDCESRNPVLTCLSKNSLKVEVIDREAKKVLSIGQWQILKPGTSTKVLINPLLCLTLSQPARKTIQDDYDHNVQDYLRDFKNAVPELDNFSLEDKDVTPFIMYRCPGLEGREYFATQKIDTGDPGYDAKVCLYNAKCKSESGPPKTTSEVAGADFGKPKYSSHSKDLVPKELYVVKHFLARENHSFVMPIRHTDLLGLHHPNLEEVADLILGSSAFMTLVNAFSQSTLHTVHQEHPLSKRDAGFVMGQIFAALAYLHAKGWIHGNLDPRSILVMSRKCLWVKLADIGLSEHVDLGKPQGYHNIYASQALRKQTQSPADIWSAGVVALQLISPDGLPARTSRDQSVWCQKLQKIASTINSERGNEATTFIKRVLTYDPQTRPKAADLLEDQWIANNSGEVATEEPNFYNSPYHVSGDVTPGPSKGFTRLGSVNPSHFLTSENTFPQSRHTSAGPSRSSSRHSSGSYMNEFVDWSQCRDGDILSVSVSRNRSRSTSTDPAIREALKSRPYPGDDWDDFDSESQGVASSSSQPSASRLVRVPSTPPPKNCGDDAQKGKNRVTRIEEDSGEETVTEERNKPAKKKRRSLRYQR